MAFIAFFSYPIPVVAGIARFKRLTDAMKVLFLFCLFSCLVAGAECVLSLNHMNNTFLSNYSFLIESAFIFVIYFFSIDSKRIKQINSVLAALFFCIWIIDKIWFAVPNQLNSEMAVASRVFIIVISILTIYTIVKKIDHQLINDPIFWVSSSTLIYSTGAIFIFGLSNELLKMGASYFITAWYINWMLAVVSNLMYTKGFFCTAKYQISYGS
ncbi:MAG: hypothetical protein WBW71_11975 [Bacteroidota bacterium]